MPKPRRIVLKLGSRLLTGSGTGLDRERMRRYAEPVARHREVETVVVSSGAIAAGTSALRSAGPPRTIPERQAAAAVGQTKLMRIWAELFAEHALEVGQVLLTHDAVLDRRRYVNARNAFSELFRADVVPIVNENDTVSVEEIRVGDNDNLAAYTAALVDADLLVLLTDVAGVYDRDPRTDPSARVLERADTAQALRAYVYAHRAEDSIGGMATKLDAAEKAARYGIPTLIASGLDARAVESIYSGQPIGTWIEGAASPLPAIRQWMAMQQRVGGAVLIDDGAAQALCAGGTSLLPRGVLGVQGRFDRGDVVALLDPHGVERARGIVAYDDRELERIRGRHSSEIEEVLGYRGAEEVIRADKLVILRHT